MMMKLKYWKQTLYIYIYIERERERERVRIPTLATKPKT